MRSRNVAPASNREPAGREHGCRTITKRWVRSCGSPSRKGQMDFERERASGLEECARLRLTGVDLLVHSLECVIEGADGQCERLPLQRFLKAVEI